VLPNYQRKAVVASGQILFIIFMTQLLGGNFMEEEKIKPEEEVTGLLEEEAVEALTVHFRRTSRGRIVDLPRWVQ
jgi:hypothetical protein